MLVSVRGVLDRSCSFVVVWAGVFICGQLSSFVVGHGRLSNGRRGEGSGWSLSLGVMSWLSLVAWLGCRAGGCCRQIGWNERGNG